MKNSNSEKSVNVEVSVNEVAKVETVVNPTDETIQKTITKEDFEVIKNEVEKSIGDSITKIETKIKKKTLILESLDEEEDANLISAAKSDIEKMQEEIESNSLVGQLKSKPEVIELMKSEIHGNTSLSESILKIEQESQPRLLELQKMIEDHKLTVKNAKIDELKKVETDAVKLELKIAILETIGKKGAKKTGDSTSTRGKSSYAVITEHGKVIASTERESFKFTSMLVERSKVGDKFGKLISDHMSVIIKETGVNNRIGGKNPCGICGYLNGVTKTAGISGLKFYRLSNKENSYSEQHIMDEAYACK